MENKRTFKHKVTGSYVMQGDDGKMYDKMGALDRNALYFASSDEFEEVFDITTPEGLLQHMIETDNSFAGVDLRYKDTKAFVVAAMKTFATEQMKTLGTNDPLRHAMATMHKLYVDEYRSIKLSHGIARSTPRIVQLEALIPTFEGLLGLPLTQFDESLYRTVDHQEYIQKAGRFNRSQHLQDIEPLINEGLKSLRGGLPTSKQFEKAVLGDPWQDKKYKSTQPNDSLFKQPFDIDANHWYIHGETKDRTRSRLERMAKLGMEEIGTASFGIRGICSGLYIEMVWSMTDEKFDSYMEWVEEMLVKTPTFTLTSKGALHYMGKGYTVGIKDSHETFKMVNGVIVDDNGNNDKYTPDELPDVTYVIVSRPTDK